MKRTNFLVKCSFGLQLKTKELKLEDVTKNALEKQFESALRRELIKVKSVKQIESIDVEIIGGYTFQEEVKKDV